MENFDPSKYISESGNTHRQIKEKIRKKLKEINYTDLQIAKTLRKLRIGKNLKYSYTVSFKNGKFLKTNRTKLQNEFKYTGYLVLEKNGKGKTTRNGPSKRQYIRNKGSNKGIKWGMVRGLKTMVGSTIKLRKSDEITIKGWG